jgi:hypothetical protein
MDRRAAAPGALGPGRDRSTVHRLTAREFLLSYNRANRGGKLCASCTTVREQEHC